MWVAQQVTSSGGDFHAYNNASAALGASVTTQLIPNTIYSGNAGGWYSTSTGRYTPPAGRYLLMASGTFGSPGGPTLVQLWLRKNGVTLAGGFTGTAIQTPATNNYFGDPQGTAIVDANGTDYFDYAVNANAATTVSSFWFAAFPISGIKGPQGDPGQLGWRLLQRTVVSSAQASVDLLPANLPGDINDLEVTFDLLPVTNDVDLYFQFYGATGVLDATSGHYSWVLIGNSAQSAGNTFQSNTSGNAGLTGSILLDYGSANLRVANTAGMGIKGYFKVPNIRASNTKGVLAQSQYLRGDGTNYTGWSIQGNRVTLEAITGLRLSFSSGNIASGTFSVWGSP
jgi:hypothetical protein